jgi:hypothetical protein
LTASVRGVAEADDLGLQDCGQLSHQRGDVRVDLRASEAGVAQSLESMADVGYLSPSVGGELEFGAGADGELVRRGEGVAEIAVLIDRDRLVGGGECRHVAGDHEYLDRDRDRLTGRAVRVGDRCVMVVDDTTGDSADCEGESEDR